jgi:hypothetical protein
MDEVDGPPCHSRLSFARTAGDCVLRLRVMNRFGCSSGRLIGENVLGNSRGQVLELCHLLKATLPARFTSFRCTLEISSMTFYTKMNFASNVCSLTQRSESILSFDSCRWFVAPLDLLRFFVG